MQVSASSWLHCPIGVPSAICFTQSSFVMYSSFWSGNCPVDSILDCVKSSFLLLAFFKKVCQSPRTFAEPITRCRQLFVSRVFFNGHRIVTVPDDIYIFLPNLFHVLFMLLSEAEYEQSKFDVVGSNREPTWHKYFAILWMIKQVASLMSHA